MPRRSDPYAGLIELLAGKAVVKYRRMDYESWAADCGMAESTLRRRIAAPEKIRLEELGRIARPLGISREDLLRAVIGL